MCTTLPTEITSPYNFVRLSPEVVCPEWGDLVSHDIPFSDGLDGELEIKIEALRPVFIRNGSDKDDHNFCRFENGKYFIPGSSLKGMVRSVLEIASYGKMQHIADLRYAIRDLQLKKYTSLFSANMQPLVKAGWLDVSDDRNWKIIPCEFARWRHERKDKSFGQGTMSAADKYDYCLKRYGTLEERADFREVNKKTEPKYKGVAFTEAVFRANGEKSGMLVFTGQPGSSKEKEFFFYDSREKDAFPVDLPENIKQNENGETVYPNRNDFIFVHRDQSKASGYDLWLGDDCSEKKITLRQKIHRFFKGRIPVFYLQEGGKLRFGLAMLFRLAGEVSTGEAARNTNPAHFRLPGEEFVPDMADLIFGYASEAKSLKGRVQFSACEAQAEVQPEPKEQIVLGSPKPTFYPSYIKQPGDISNKDQYKTFLDKDAELRGWKRYPALGEQDTRRAIENDDMAVSFAPLPAGTVFTGVIRYHNLRPVELGALLWALQLGNNEIQAHTIGMAKPYGFGRIKVSVENIDADRQKEYYTNFEKYILAQLNARESYAKIKSFGQLPEIKALLNMAKFGSNWSVDWHFNYLSLESHSQAKGSGLVLENYPCPARPATPVVQKTTPVPQAKRLEEEFLEKHLGKKAKEFIKELEKSDCKFSAEEIARIIKKFKLNNKFLPEYEEKLKKMLDD
ncbi:MAG: TIGR03986 family CRISPR-associated RAMP protein [Lentisphaeria bacterium]|nr:TIGR03986 family CRISPR-associated RAMP protein [Lentisphaeria bacterium]